jgi:hypothetical protein
VPVVIVTHINAHSAGGTFEFCVICYGSQREQIILVTVRAKYLALEHFTSVYGLTHRFPQTFSHIKSIEYAVYIKCNECFLDEIRPLTFSKRATEIKSGQYPAVRVEMTSDRPDDYAVGNSKPDQIIDHALRLGDRVFLFELGHLLQVVRNMDRRPLR